MIKNCRISGSFYFVLREKMEKEESTQYKRYQSGLFLVMKDSLLMKSSRRPHYPDHFVYIGGLTDGMKLTQLQMGRENEVSGNTTR